MSHFELWDRETASLIFATATEEEARSVVREAVVRYGPQIAETLLLGSEDDEGRSRCLAYGKAIWDRPC